MGVYSPLLLTEQPYMLLLPGHQRLTKSAINGIVYIEDKYDIRGVKRF